MKPSILVRNFRFLILALAGLLCSPPGLQADEIELLIVAKEQRYRQTSAGEPVRTPDLEDRYGVIVLIQADLESILSSVTVSNALSNDPIEGEFEGPFFQSDESFLTKAELDEVVPPGATFTFHIGTENGSNFAATLTVPSDAYPNTPHVANWTAGQNIDSFSDFTLRWDPMTGGSAQDFIYVQIASYGGEEEEDEDFFASPFFLEPNVLTGQSNSIVIPANTLEPGRTYIASIIFANIPNANTNLFPGGLFALGFVKETEFMIQTAAAPPPEGRIQFASTNIIVNETNGTVEIVLDRVGGSQGDVTVQLRALGLTATSGADFNPPTQLMIFADGVTSLSTTMTIHDDFLLEGNERLRLGLSQAEGGVLLSQNTNAIVTITDNEDTDAGELSFSAATYQVTEASGATVKVIVSRTSGTTGDVGAEIQRYGGTATSGDDFEEVSDDTFTVLIAAGQKASTNIITILDDELPEGSETILLRLANPTGGATLGKITNNTITIRDDEITIQFASASYTNVENKVEAKVTLVRSGPSTESVSVDYATGAGFSPANGAPEAEVGADYLGTTGTVVFARGVTEKTFTVRLIDDLAVEDFERIPLTIGNPNGALIGPMDSAGLYIKDNDLGGRISFTLTNQNVKEAVGNAKIIVTRTGGLASNVTVRLSTHDGSALDLADYIGFSSNLVFGPKEVKKTIPLSVIQDALVENKENFTLSLRDVSSNAGSGKMTNLTVNISDDDSGGKIAFDKAAYSVNEGTTNLAIILKRTDGSASNVTVRFRTFDGPLNGATDEDDYYRIDTIVYFGPGQTRATNYLHIIDDDVADQPLPETILMTLDEYTGGARPGLSNSVVAIVDNESGVSFASDASMGFEGSTLTIPIARSGFLGTTSRVDFMFMDGTATNGVDFNGTNGFVIFKPGDAVKNITVKLTADPNVESNETFTITLKNATNALFGTHTNITVTVKDKPDPNAIGSSGSSFLKLSIKGIEGNSFSDSMEVDTGDFEVLLGNYESFFGGGGFHPLSASRTSPTSKSVTFRNLTGLFLKFNSTGIITLGDNSPNGGLLYTKTVTPIPSGTATVAAYSTDEEGAGGTVTIDVFDIEGDVIAGRFDLIVIETTTDKKARMTGSFRVKGDKLTAS